MGWLSGFFEGVADAVSGFLGGVSSFVESIGLGGVAGILSTIASFAIPGLGLPEILSIISLVAEIVGVLAKALGLNEKEEKPEKIGFKSEVAELKPENFDNNMVQYNQYLSKYELTEEQEERFASLTEEEINKYKVVGMGIEIEGIKEKLSENNSTVTNLTECIRDLARVDMSSEEILECVQQCTEAGICDLTDITNYLAEKNTVESAETIGGALTEAIGNLYPELTQNGIAEKIGDMSEMVRKLYKE